MDVGNDYVYRSLCDGVGFFETSHSSSLHRSNGCFADGLALRLGCDTQSISAHNNEALRDHLNVSTSDNLALKTIRGAAEDDAHHFDSRVDGLAMT